MFFFLLVGNPTCRQPYSEFFYNLRYRSKKNFEDSDSFIESELLEKPNVGKQIKKYRVKSNNKQKTGRKCMWCQVVLDNFIYIIVSSDQ